MLARDFYVQMAEIIQTSDKTFYRYGPDRRSYQDLHKAVRKLSSIFQPLNEARVATYAAKSFDVYAGVFSVLLNGNTWVPLNPLAPDSRNAGMVRQAMPRIILCDRDLGPEMAAAAEAAESRIVRLDKILDGDSEVDLEVPEIRDDAVSMIYFTSGSTGEPKGVLVTHRNYILNVENILRILDVGEEPVFADYHDLGFVISVPVLFPCIMSVGALSPGIDPRDSLLPISHLVENEVSVLITVPSTIARLRKGNRTGVLFDKLRILISCGEPLHKDILDYAFKQMPAADVLNFYGSTEVAPWIFCHRCRPEDLTDYEAFGYIPIGRPIDGNVVKVTEEGELWVSGPQIVPGYLNDRDRDRFPVVDGVRWYRTGDKVVVLGDTFICKGRLDSQIKIGGYRIELMDVESHLRALDGVESAVCFVEGGDLNKVIVAVLITAKLYTLSEVRAFLGGRLPSYMLPRRIHCVKDLPLNKSGKVDRAGIIAEYSSA